MKSLLPRAVIMVGLCTAQLPSVRAASSPADAIRPHSVWSDGKGLALTILERGGDSFRGRFETGTSVREVAGSVRGANLSWLAAASVA